MVEFAPAAARRADLWEIIAAGLRQAIILRELPPGMHLREPLIAEKFATSRVPVREALIRLEHEGLVRREPRRGAFVVGMSLSDIEELYDIRSLLEGRAARLAAERATPAEITRLQTLVADMDGALSGNRSGDLAVADLAFHRQIMASARHRRIVAAWEPMAGIVQTLMTLTNEHRLDDSMMPSHQALADAIADRDAKTAEAITDRSLENGLRAIRAMWDEQADSAEPAG